MRVKFSKSAHLDIVDGWHFYNSQQEGLGDYFSDTIYSEAGSLALYAGIHTRVYGFYRLLSGRFPYSIYYDIEDSGVVVYAVIGNKRNPDWIDEHLSLAR
ncbi:MAG: type II toxin-antitoxin system RelE/ParE family toxin [Kiritimatiellae bacterium]|nr:type II toxin-antitoxin system RelE/ParE family toxin [Kiritimatiellia bacterium]